jgi:hypothetical protein
MSGPHDFAVRGQRPSSSDVPRPSHPASRFVTIAHTPLLPRRDGARNAADLRNRSTATNWHDGQISRWRENAVEEIFSVICEQRRGKVNAVILVERERRIVMAGHGPAIHVFISRTKKVSRTKKQDVDHRDKRGDDGFDSNTGLDCSAKADLPRLLTSDNSVAPAPRRIRFPTAANQARHRDRWARSAHRLRERHAKNSWDRAVVRPSDHHSVRSRKIRNFHLSRR